MGKNNEETEKRNEIKNRFDLYAMKQRSKLSPVARVDEIDRIESKIQTIKEVCEIMLGFSLEDEPVNDGIKVED